MIIEPTEAIKAVTLWSAVNFGLMLVLALNTFRWRLKEMVAVGIAKGSPGLERAVRAHGNNIEYVPSILLGFLLLAILGESSQVLHIAGAILFIARVLHAYGIQQLDVAVPKTRVAGNLLCWLLFLALVVRLILLSF